MEVAQSKAPGSRVAGKATVLVFPDPNTGNTTYKAVQRAANIICVGPMLQRLRRHVNDITRGALVVYTIALASIQAEYKQPRKDPEWRKQHSPKIGNTNNTEFILRLLYMC